MGIVKGSFLRYKLLGSDRTKWVNNKPNRGYWGVAAIGGGGYFVRTARYTTAATSTAMPASISSPGSVKIICPSPWAKYILGGFSVAH
jgi:hypothetical protein